MNKEYIIVFFILIISTITHGQVGINTSNPNPNSLIHISETDESMNKNIKGLMIPRLTSSERDQLTYTDPLVISSGFKLSDLDNSLMIFNITENCFNYWNAIEKTWKSLCGNLGEAVFEDINCSDVIVNGNYFVSKEVNNTNFITISNIVVTKPGSYTIIIESSNNNGYIFKGEGVFNTIGNHTIKLYAEGTPINQQIDIFTLHPSLTSDNCTFTIQVQSRNDGIDNDNFTSLPSLTYLSIAGSINQGYSWGADNQARINAMRSPVNFGPNGIVKINWFKPYYNDLYFGSDNNNPNIGFLSPNDAQNMLINELAKDNGKLPDIIFYAAYATGSSEPITTNLITELVKYVNKGGVLIYATNDSDTTHANLLVSGIFGPGYNSAYKSLSDNDIYPINNLPNDPIINGVFGNASNEYWAEDNKNTIFFGELPPNSVQIASAKGLNYTANNDETKSVVWYNKDKNFFYFGDSVGTGTSDSNSTYPSHFIGNSPIPKLQGNPKKMESYNSVIEMNAVVWAARRAMQSGINPH